MRIILVSGGSGKRLWPMSNDLRSKQFLKVLESPDGGFESMLQRVWRQVGAVGLQRHSYVCASKAQMDAIRGQLGDVPVIVEPDRRDTFSAISLATVYLADEGCSDDEVVVAVPVDHFVEDDYFVQIAKLESILRSSGADLALLGVVPTLPTSKYGYIVPGREVTGNGRFRVRNFVEKPEPDTAEALIEQGALWNCGVFCFRLGFLKSILAKRGLPTDYAEMVERFSSMPCRSFDYEVVEQTSSIVVASYDGSWKDLGTWGTLTEEISQPFMGRGQLLRSENTHVINELDIPMVAMGLRDAVVVATPDGILVADKAETVRLKDAISMYDDRPMYEERRWGSYRVLDYRKLEDGTEVLTKFIEMSSGHNLSYQKHMRRSEVWTVVEGEGEVALDSRILRVTAGDVIRVHHEQWHALRAVTKLKFVEVQRGSELVEEDIVRRYMNWEDVERHCSMGLN